MSAAAMTHDGVSMHDLENCLEKAVKEITTTMFSCESKMIPCDQVELVPPGVTATVGFGGKISGFVAIHLSPRNACALAEGLLGMSFTEMDEIVADAMGEMANMLAGGLKKFACQNEDLFRISVPSVVFGSDYSTHAPKNADTAKMGVEAGACSFMIQLVASHQS